MRYLPSSESDSCFFEVFSEETVVPDDLQDAIVTNLQRVRVDDDDVIDEMGSLSQSAEALRLTAAAPPRNQNLGGDSDA